MGTKRVEWSHGPVFIGAGPSGDLWIEFDTPNDINVRETRNTLNGNMKLMEQKV